MRELGKHIFAGAGFASNFVLWSEAGYFDEAAETKPLLHLWSLGVEEQFYIVWPAVLWASWRLRFPVPIVILALGLGSFAFNLHQAGVDAVADFYSPQTRFWELLSGALLAWVMLHRAEIGRSFEKLGFVSQQTPGRLAAAQFLAGRAGLAGVALIGLGFALIKPDSGYPGAWALFPVLGAVLLIASGPGADINKRVLSHPLAVWFGVISYPLYLWHWPLLSFARVIEGDQPKIAIRLSVVAFAIVLAWLTYRFMERPFRFGAPARFKVPALAAAMLALALIGAAASLVDERALQAALRLNRGDPSRQVGWKVPVGTDLQASSCRTRFPDRASRSSAMRDDNFCYLQRNDADPNVVMIGDSLNLSLFPGLARYDDFNLLVLSASAAAPFYNTRSTDDLDEVRRQNYRMTNQALDYAIASPDIKVVVLSFLSGALITQPDLAFQITDLEDPNNSNAREVFEHVATRTLRRLTAAGKKVVYILPYPTLPFEVERCLAQRRQTGLGASEETCQLGDLAPGSATYRDWTLAVLKKFPEVKLVDLEFSLCKERHCSLIKDGELLFRDRIHLTLTGSAVAAKVLHPAIIESLRGG